MDTVKDQAKLNAGGIGRGPNYTCLRKQWALKIDDKFEEKIAVKITNGKRLLPLMIK